MDRRCGDSWTKTHCGFPEMRKSGHCKQRRFQTWLPHLVGHFGHFILTWPQGSHGCHMTEHLHTFAHPHESGLMRRVWLTYCLMSPLASMRSNGRSSTVEVEVKSFSNLDKHFEISLNWKLIKTLCKFNNSESHSKKSTSPISPSFLLPKQKPWRLFLPNFFRQWRSGTQ